MPDLTAYIKDEALAMPAQPLADYSIYTQELLGKPPAWILRWGGSLILAIILAAVVLAWLVKYPDIVAAKVTITTPTPPAAVVARQGGKLHWLKNAGARHAARNEPIAVIDSAASYTDVMRLKAWLKGYLQRRDELSYMQDLPQNLRLGDSQSSFAAFQKLINEWLFFLQSDPLSKKIALIRKKQAQLELMLSKFRNQDSLLQNENVLLDKNLQRFQELRKRNLVSANSVEEKQLTLLNSHRQQEQLGLEASRTRVELTNLSAELNELQLADANKRENFRLSLEEAFQALQTGLGQWEKNYLLIAPIDGHLVFSKFWGEYQVVNAGEEVVTIVPVEQQTIIAKMKMPPENSGKVKKGQKILIKLAGYPYQEYGQIVSSIHSISPVPRENLYTVDAILPSPLVTSYHKTLSFHQEMQGQAEIVTEDVRLLERIFYQIRKMLKKTE